MSTDHNETICDCFDCMFNENGNCLVCGKCMIHCNCGDKAKYE
jgi:hypothetical protein